MLFKRLSKCPEQTKQEKISKSIWNSIKAACIWGICRKEKAKFQQLSSDTIQQPMQILDFYELSPSIKKQHTPLYIPLSVNGRTTLCPFALVQYVQTLPLLVLKWLTDWRFITLFFNINSFDPDSHADISKKVVVLLSFVGFPIQKQLKPQICRVVNISVQEENAMPD